MTVSSIEVEVPVLRPTLSRGRTAPALSVIVTSRRDRAHLHALLSQLVPQCARADAELVVVRPGPPAEWSSLAKAFASVRFVSAPADVGDGQLRHLAMLQANGDVFAFIDDRRAPERGWVEMLRTFLGDGPLARPAGPPARPTPVHDGPGGREAFGYGAAAEGLAFDDSRLATHRVTGDAPSEGGGRPHLSVIVPVHQGAEVLGASLAALSASDVPRASWELIVVDDASTDDSALAAAPYADVIVRLPHRPYGPAYARNRGYQVSRGDVLVFVDADVCVHPETLGRFAAAFAEDPEVSAISGSYDDRPPGDGLVSRYRNLLQHFHHQQGAGPVDRFWACCGAVRSSVFAEAGMYDEWRFRRPQIEDIELGRRIRALGHRAVLRPDIQATHLKEWTLGSMVATTLHDRGVPWVRLDAEQPGGQAKPQRSVQLVNTGYTWLAILLLGIAAAAREPWYAVAAAVPLVPVLANNRHHYAFFARRWGVGFALAAVPLDLLNYAVNGVALAAGWVLREVVGESKPDPAVQAFAEVGIKTWPPVPARSAVLGLAPASAAGAAADGPPDGAAETHPA